MTKFSEVELRDALAYDFVGFDKGSVIPGLIFRASSALGRVPKFLGQVRSFEAECRLIQKSIGIGVLPEVAVAPFLETMNLSKIKLIDSWSQRELSIGVRDIKALSPAAQTVYGLATRQTRSCVGRQWLTLSRGMSDWSMILYQISSVRPLQVPHTRNRSIRSV